MIRANSPKFSDYFAYFLLMVFSLLSRLLPLVFWCQMGRLFGGFLYLLGAPFKRISMVNLRFAYGDELTRKERRSITRGNIIHLGIGVFEWIRMLRLTEKRRQQICQKVMIEGQEHLDAARKAKGKIILLSAHYGQWEYATLKYASEINPLSFIVRAIDNPLVERERWLYHDRFGARILYKDSGLREAIRGLNRGEDLLLLPDRKAQLHEGIPAQFFNQKTSTLTIAVSLAQKYDAALVPMFILRSENLGGHRLIFEPALEVENLPLAEAVQLQNDCIERQIRRHPEMWLWLHRKWKCYHEEIYRR